MAGKSIAAAAAFAGAACLAPAAVVLDAPGHVAVEGAAVMARGGEPGATWRLLDWRGRDTGVAGAFDENGLATLPPLPSGYYRLGSLASLAVVPNPDAFPPDPLSPIGIDACASWFANPGRFLCPWNGGDGYRTVADLVRLAGVAHVRERLSWEKVQRRPDVGPSWGNYTNVTALYRSRGVGVLQMFHDAPGWAGPAPKLPRDLDALWRFGRDAAAGFGDDAEAWEFWNEPNKGFAPEPAWDYAAALKAAYLGFKAARPDLPVLLGGLAGVPNETAYESVLLANDAAKYFDVYGWHTYRSIAQYGKFAAAIRDNLARAGVPDRAVWVTEFGTNADGLSDTEGAIKGKGLMEHSPEQELVQAEFYPKAEIAFRAEGFARDFFFVFCPVNERGGRKVWGVMRRDGAVKPVYAAIATLVRETGAARLLGAMDAPLGIRAWLFERPDGSQTVAFWAESPLDTQRGFDVVRPEPDFALEWRLAANGPCRLADMCGLVSQVFPDAEGILSLTASRFPSYVSGMRGLRADRPAKEPGRVLPYEPELDENLSIVIRADVDRDDFEIGDSKTLAIMKGASGRMRLQVWNFGDEPVTGLVEAAGARVEGLPTEPFAVGPRGSGPVEIDCSVIGDGAGEDRETVVFSGLFGGRRASRLAIPVLFERRFEAGAVRVPLAWDDPVLWQRNDSAQTYRVARDEAEGGALRFDVAWADDGTDRWFYPVHALDLPHESLAGARALEFEVKSAQDKVENDFATCLVMLAYGNGRGEKSIGYLEPTGEWERRRVMLPPNADLASVTAIRIGGNPQGHSLAFWIRDLEILRPKDGTATEE